MLSNSATHWGALTRTLHWLIAALILVQFALGWIGHEMDDTPAKVTWMIGHKSVGVTILLLTVFRLSWRLPQNRPVAPTGIAIWQHRAAVSAHWALYALVLGLAIAGWVIADTSRIPWNLWWVIPLPDWLGPAKDLHEVAEEAHEFLAWSLFAVIALHVLAALWHQFVRRDDTLRRMWSG